MPTRPTKEILQAIGHSRKIINLRRRKDLTLYQTYQLTICGNTFCHTPTIRVTSRLIFGYSKMPGKAGWRRSLARSIHTVPMGIVACGLSQPCHYGPPPTHLYTFCTGLGAGTLPPHAQARIRAYPYPLRATTLRDPPAPPEYPQRRVRAGGRPGEPPGKATIRICIYPPQICATTLPLQTGG